MMTGARLVERVATDAPIEWWNENRRKYNSVVNEFNAWVIYGESDLTKRRMLLNIDLLSREILPDSPFAEEGITYMLEAIGEVRSP